MPSREQLPKADSHPLTNRVDVREPGATILYSTKSINLALSERGINSLRQTGFSDLADAVVNETFPMYGRMLHMEKNGEYVRTSQQYDARGKVGIHIPLTYEIPYS